MAVFLYALATAAATGLGALPFLFVRRMPRSWLGVSNALAAGLMGAASWTLLDEGFQYDGAYTLLGGAAGFVFIALTNRALRGRHVHWGELPNADALKILFILGIMTLHSFTEGIGVGVSFGGGDVLGLYITAAIALHNIPEGLAISLVMIPLGTPVWKAALWSIFTSLPQPLMAVPAFLFVETFRDVLPAGLGFAAGAMTWMIAAELLPSALRDARRAQVAGAIAVAVILMLLFQAAIRG